MARRRWPFVRAWLRRVHNENRKAVDLRIRISSAELIDELLASLRAEPGAVVEQISADEAEVTLLGSYQEDALRMELYLRLRAWEAAHSARGVHVEIVG